MASEILRIPDALIGSDEEIELNFGQAKQITVLDSAWATKQFSRGQVED